MNVLLGRHGGKAVFFDRDGTLSWPAPPGEYIRRPEHLRLLPGAAAAVRRVKYMNFAAILATNQRWLAEPDANLNVYASVEARLSQLLAAEGAQLDASYTCPHAANSCDCRKPLPGLLLRAANDLSLSLRDSYFIGDSITDAQAGAAAGMKAILISQEQFPDASCQATYVVGNIENAVEVIIDTMHG